MTTGTRRATAICGLCVLVVMASACTAGPNGRSPQATDLAQPAADVSQQPGEFVSPLYGYSLVLPDDWQATSSATRLLAHGELPEAGFPMVDTFRGPIRRNLLVVAAQPVSLSTTLEGWADFVAAMTEDCERPTADQAETDLGGEPSVVVVDGSCFGIEHLWLAVIHGERGYHFAWLGDREHFQQVRSSFKFTP